MENNQYLTNQHLEQQLKDSFIEIKQLKRENQLLYSTFEESKFRNDEIKKQQNIINELEETITILKEENNKLQSEIIYLRGCSQTMNIQVIQKSSYQQIETELQDLQQYLKKYLLLQDSLIEQLPYLNLQLCWKEITQLFKEQFNTNQQIQNLQDELTQNEISYKEIIHSKIVDLNPLQEISKQQTIREIRVEIERIRKDVQFKQSTIKQQEQSLLELQNEFTYICKIESRKNNIQLEQQKQLIDYKKGYLTTQNSKPSLLYGDQNQENIPQRFNDTQLRVPKNNQIMNFQKPSLEISAVKNNEELYFTDTKSPIEKTIDFTRKKLSRQLSQANSLRDYKNI